MKVRADSFRVSVTLATGLLVAILAGCANEIPDAPLLTERKDVVGSYAATTFTTTSQGNTTDQLAKGAELTIRLRAKGTTEGRLFVPAGADDGGDFRARLDGTWTFLEPGDKVQFDHPADTFVRDMTFRATRIPAWSSTIELQGKGTFGNTTIEVHLRKQ